MALTVSTVARLSGVSVRALHHYDEIGLLQPSGRSDAGYRLYDEADLQRLQQILFFRALELPLPEIARIMKDPAFDVAATLRSQREMLVARLASTHALITAVDAAIVRIEKGDPVAKTNEKTTEEKTDEMFAAFKEFRNEDYEAEAEQRWGNTEAFKESKRRTARYTKADWERMGKESAALYVKLAELMEAGVAPDAAAAMDAAEEHRQHISRWFYDCTYEIHVGLGDLYVNDARFTANIDKARPGLAAYLRLAIIANAARARKQP
jgi:DNA-binding transcriptional MerR regulator